jgi:hypothetical protein
MYYLDYTRVFKYSYHLKEYLERNPDKSVKKKDIMGDRDGKKQKLNEGGSNDIEGDNKINDVIIEEI